MRFNCKQKCIHTNKWIIIFYPSNASWRKQTIEYIKKHISYLKKNQCKTQQRIKKKEKKGNSNSTNNK
jgi:hypothetical protein